MSDKVHAVLRPENNPHLTRGCMTFLLLRFQTLLLTGYNKTLSIGYPAQPLKLAHQMTGAERIAYMGYVYSRIPPDTLRRSIREILGVVSPDGITANWCKWALLNLQS